MLNTKKSVIHRWEVPSLTKQSPKKKSRKGVIIRLSGYILKYRFLFLAALALSFLANQFALLGPLYSGYAIDAISAPGGVNFDAVGKYVINMLVCFALAAVGSYLLSVLMIVISQKIVCTMRKQLFDKLTELPVSFFDRTATGDIVSRISYDIDTVNSSLSHDIVQVLTSVYTVVGSLIFMWNISKPMILVFVITVPASIIFTRFRSKKVRPLFQKRSRKLGELNGYAEEMLSGCQTIQCYRNEQKILNRFDQRNTDAMQAYYDAEYYGATLGPTVNFINNLSLSLVMIAGGILYMYSSSGAVESSSVFFITLGGIAQFVQYSRKFAGPINEFANILHEFQSAFSAAERVFAILDTEPEKSDKQNCAEIGEEAKNVEFKNVTFGYTPDKTIIRNINIAPHPNKTIAIVGPTGAGKTTIINLLMRFYDAETGEIIIDGHHIENIRRESLRKAYTMVLQDAWLFNGTIYENIAYGKENATEEEVKKAAEAAKIASYIEKLPDGYNTVLSDGGINISKGQRQLITIARALLSDSPVLILDEATSNVDSRTEIQIRQAMDELTRNRTSFIIAHRLSTIKNADLIIVIQDGEISESGNHDELLKKGGFYATLYNSQFK